MPFADPDKRREYHREYGKRWDEENPEKRAAIQSRHDKKRQYTPKRRKQIAENRIRRNIRQRVMALEQYGGKCAFCENENYEHLTIDHINSDGKMHRAEISGRYSNIYDFLCRTDFRPDLYRVLCWNCHMARTLYDVVPGGEILRGMDHWRQRGALRRRANVA